MVRRMGFVLASILCLAVASCNSLFDSYFPENVEYLDTQTNISSALGGSPVVQMLMGYLPATTVHSSDILVVVAATQDGGSHVLFYDPSNLSLRKSYSDSDFKNQNGGTVPALFLIGQDGGGIYTGVIPYDPQSLAIGTALNFTNNTNNFITFRETYDGTSAVLSGPNSGVGVWQDSSFSNIGNTSIGTLAGLPTSSNLNLLDLSFRAGTYYFVVSSGSTVYLASGQNLPTVSVANVNVSGSNSVQGWASSSAAVVLNQTDNSNLLTAYSWSGASLASLHLPKTDQQNITLALKPDGSSWYLFDSSTGKLSRNRPWW